MKTNLFCFIFTEKITLDQVTVWNRSYIQKFNMIALILIQIVRLFIIHYAFNFCQLPLTAHSK